MNIKGFLKFVIVILIASVLFRSVLIGIGVFLLYLVLGALAKDRIDNSKN